MGDQAQRHQALDTSRSFLIQAPAGSGKTELLTQRYLKLLSISDAPESVLAMTFSKKAVSELKARVIDALKSTQNDRPSQAHKQVTYDLALGVLAKSNALDWHLLDMPQRLKISTIDGLSNLITSRYPRPDTWVNNKILTQTWQQDNIYAQAAKQTLLSIDSDEFGQCVGDTLLYLDNKVERFYQLIIFMLKKRDQWLNKLYQQGALNIDNLKQSAENVIIQHLGLLKKEAKNHLDSAFFDLLKYNTEARFSQIQTLPNSDAEHLEAWKNIADILLDGKSKKNNKWRESVNKNNGFPTEVKAQKDEFIKFLNYLKDKDEFKNLLFETLNLPDVEFGVDQIQALSNIAQVLKIAVAQLNILFDEQQSADFIQVALDADQALTNQQDSDIALFLDYKIQHLLIDEFQDTSATQFALVEKLVADWQQTDAKTLFLVGDPMQSIYLFRQSQVGLFLQVKAFGIADLKPEFLQLSTNFRSEKVVVESNNQYFSKIFPQQENAKIGAIGYSASTANLPDSQQGGVKFYPFAQKCYAQEAQQVLDIVLQNLDKEVAILVRGRSHLSEIVPALKAAGVPFEALKTAPLKNEIFTRDLISLTRSLLDLGDKIAWLAILRAPWCGLLLADILKLSEHQDKVIFDLLNMPEVLATLSLDGAKRAQSLYQILLVTINNRSRFSAVQTLEFALESLCPQHFLTEQQRMIKRQFLAVVHECEALGQLNVKTTNQQLEELYTPSISSNVKLMTIHEAKGLEFDVVIIPGLGRGSGTNKSAIIQLQEFTNQSLLLAPIKSYQQQNPSNTYRYLQYVESRQGHFESMRLLYVAMTRAKSSIHLLATLNANNKASNNTFLKLLEPLLQAQFKKAAAVINEAKMIDNTEKLERYQTMLDALIVADDAHENIEFNKSIDVGFKSLLGTFIHQCLEFGAFNLTANQVKTRLIELGFSLENIKPAADHVLELLANTKQDTNFEWLFKPRSSTQVEAEFIFEGRSFIIDRLFIDDDILWIVDFKTASQLGNESVKQFSQRQALKHRKQLLFYKQILAETYTNKIQCALYCPSVQKIIKID
ncbi:UvrD-helicase domain-containing protein [Candidatus Thioglobus sp.]|uniref:UvrD-helicase domain-containing protein n=1 Tax=Candidatus Thioglobus sp. TaxID=2026721 RepID=UPI003D0B741C